MAKKKAASIKRSALKRKPAAPKRPAVAKPTKKADDYYRLMVETITDYGITRLDPEGRVVSWNPGAEAIKGYKADEIIGQHISKFYPKEAVDRGWPDHELKRALAEGRFEDQGWRVKKDGSQFWANVIITPLRDSKGNHIGFAKITRDFTERKQLDEALAAEKSRSQAILYATADGLITIDERGTVASMNGAAERLFGYQAEEVIGRNVNMLMPSPYREEHDGYLQNYTRTGIAKIIGKERELEAVRKDGRKFPIALRVSEMRDGDKRVFIGTVQDITARKAVEAENARLQARAQAIFQFTADCLITIDERGLIQSCNATAEKLFGYRSEQLIGKNISTLAASPYREEHDSYLQNYLRTGIAKIMGKERELEAIRSDGSKFPIALRIAEMKDGDKRLFIGTVQDITGRKNAETERQRLFDAIRDAVNRLATSCREILATTTQQTAGAEHQAAAVSETVITVDELAQTSDQANERARGVAEAARRADEVGNIGRKAIEESITAMGDVKSQVESIAENMLSLAERAQAISEITLTVNDIAEQTNVLALNAAVEAARAGEHGRGFAVVASEVKSLAEESKKATAQVRRILGEIQQATNSAVMSTEHGTRAVSSTAEIVSKAGETIKDLSSTIADAARAAGQISASAGQQAAATIQVREGMKSIEKVTRENVLAIQQIQLAAQNLTALSNELASLTSG